MRYQTPPQPRFTPWPWKILKCRCGDSVCRRYYTDNGSFSNGSGYDIYDATLIAAAPKLFEQLADLALAANAALETLSQCPNMNSDEILRTRLKNLDEQTRLSSHALHLATDTTPLTKGK